MRHDEVVAPGSEINPTLEAHHMRMGEHVDLTRLQSHPLERARRQAGPPRSDARETPGPARRPRHRPQTGKASSTSRSEPGLRLTNTRRYDHALPPFMRSIMAVVDWPGTRFARNTRPPRGLHDIRPHNVLHPVIAPFTSTSGDNAESIPMVWVRRIQRRNQRRQSPPSPARAH